MLLANWPKCLVRYDRGVVLCQESLALFKAIGDSPKGWGIAVTHLADIKLSTGRPGKAARLLFGKSLWYSQQGGGR